MYILVLPVIIKVRLVAPPIRKSQRKLKSKTKDHEPKDPGGLTMTFLVLFGIVVFFIVGMMITGALRFAAREAGILNRNQIAESTQARKEFNELVKQLTQLSAKPDPRVRANALPPEWQEAILERVPMDDDNFVRLMERLHRGN